MIRRLLALILLVASNPAAATTYVLDMSGSVTGVHASLASQFGLGQPITAQLRYDAVAALGTDPQYQYYPGAVLGGFVTIGSYRVDFTSSARLITGNDTYHPAGLTYDRLLFDNFGPQAMPVAGAPLTVIGLSFEDSDGTALSGHALPTQTASLAGFDAANLSADFGNYLASDLQRVSGQFTSYTITEVSPVPEPSQWVMLLIGFGLLGAVVRRRAKETTLMTASHLG